MNWEPRNLQPWHHRVLDMVIANPSITNEEIAQELQVHPVTVGLVRRTDMFKMMLDDRQARLSSAVDSFALDRIRGKVVKLAEQSVELVSDQVEIERKMTAAGGVQGISKGALEGCEMALRALGFIGSGGGAAPAQVNISNSQVVVADGRMLASARQRMREIANASHDAGASEALPSSRALSLL